MAEGEELSSDSLQFGSEIEFEFFCEFCIEDDKILEAEGFCVDCEEYLCNECTTHHKRSRSARYHEVLGKEKMPKDKRMSSDRASKDIKTKCRVHKGKRIEFYCNDHGVLGCSTCVPMEHRNCKNVVNILEVSDDFLGGVEYRQFVQQLKDLEKTSRDTFQLARDNTSAAERYKSEARGAVQKLRDRMNSRFDTLETDIDKEVTKIEKEDVDKLKSVSASCDDILEKTNIVLNDIQTLNASRKVCQLYIYMKEVNTCYKDLQHKLKEIGRQNNTRPYRFEPDKRMKDVLNLSNNIGKVSVLDALKNEMNESASVEYQSHASYKQAILVYPESSTSPVNEQIIHGSTALNSKSAEYKKDNKNSNPPLSAPFWNSQKNHPIIRGLPTENIEEKKQATSPSPSYGYSQSNNLVFGKLQSSSSKNKEEDKEATMEHRIPYPNNPVFGGLQSYSSGNIKENKEASPPPQTHWLSYPNQQSKKQSANKQSASSKKQKGYTQ